MLWKKRERALGHTFKSILLTSLLQGEESRGEKTKQTGGHRGNLGMCAEGRYGKVHANFEMQCGWEGETKVNPSIRAQ